MSLQRVQNNSAMVTESFDLGCIDLQYGGSLPHAQIAYEVHGALNNKKDNVILFPTWCAGDHTDLRYLIGPQRALNPDKYFIVTVNLFGNGKSSSPSNTAPPFDRTRFPHVSVLDNVKCQRRLLVERFGIDVIKLIVGRSMGAQVAFQWGCYYPDKVGRILALAGSGRTTPHNFIFVATMKTAIMSGPDWDNGEYKASPVEALKQFRLNADAWGFSQEFYRQKRHLNVSFTSTQQYLDRNVPVRNDANDLLAQFRTWETVDISDNEKFGKDFAEALAAIKARAIIMPVQTDLYFPPEDSAFEVKCMPNAELRVMPSIWGHRGGSPGSDPVDIGFVDKAVADLLAE